MRQRKPPIFMPAYVWPDFAALSKDALLDVAWNLAARCSDHCDNPRVVANTLQQECKLVREYRQRESIGGG
jgi:hypothetical protein